ncbi:hypothetical protein Ahy_B03g062517 [Arachis hypogaea]|uniref:Aminotransferase-like plant mobile domain-containing protein n=1 Tax=Arachis hypogaea TaxID=3818 RepID=A0A444ZUW7_ARAHY|nr:hypothetical protein Ahy_B03g062517 [Arachis hypogaea]
MTWTPNMKLSCRFTGGQAATTVGGREVDFYWVRMTWVKDRVAHTPDRTIPDTLCQYVRCYLMMLIGVFLFTDKSATLVPLRWLPLLEDFDRCSWLSWESALLCRTYYSLCIAASCDVTDIVGCMPLLVWWIYHRFLSFSLVGYDVVRFPLVSRYAYIGR